jgi:hypothetical protein
LWKFPTSSHLPPPTTNSRGCRPKSGSEGAHRLPALPKQPFRARSGGHFGGSSVGRFGAERPTNEGQFASKQLVRTCGLTLLEPGGQSGRPKRTQNDPNTSSKKFTVCSGAGQVFTRTFAWVPREGSKGAEGPPEAHFGLIRLILELFRKAPPSWWELVGNFHKGPTTSTQALVPLLV